MDLRSLINKLDTIEKRQLLQESEQLMEKARIRYSDVEAVAKQYPADEAARGQALAKLARDNGLPGLFDPVSRELVNPDGSLSTFKGADQATVDRLKQWGLLPLGAKTSSWLGFRGEDEKIAMGDNQTAQGRDALVDKAEALMKKAVEVAAKATITPPPAKKDEKSTEKKAGQSAMEGIMFTSGIGKALMEEFGYNPVALLESITPEEHTELKDIITKLTPFASTDPDVTDIIGQFKAYNQQRDQIIKRIMEIIQVIKSKPVKKDVKTPEKKVIAKESLQESKSRMLAEGRVQIIVEGKRYLRDGLEWTYDKNTKLYSHLNEDGTVVQLDESEFWQGAADFGRGVGSGLTAGYADNISAGVQALFTSKTYKDALKAELAKTKQAQERSPWLYYGGSGLGFIANPLSKVGFGIPFMAATYASDKLVREPWNKSVLGDKPGPNQGGMDENSIKAMQVEILKRDPNALPRFGADGKMGKETQAALAKYPDIAKKYMKQGTADVAPAPAPVKVTAEQAKELVYKIKQVAKEKGVSDAEAAATMMPQLGESEQQLDEIGWLVNALRGGAEAGLKAGGDAAVKGGVDAGASLQNTMANMVRGGGRPLAADTAPSIINRGGQTWEKVGNNYYNRMTRQVLSAEEMLAKGGLEAAAKAGPEAVVSRFGPEATSALSKLRAAGGNVLKWINNNKFLTAMAIIAIAGYAFSPEGEIEDPNGPNGPVGPIGPGVEEKPNQGGMDEVSPEMTELQRLVDQLYGGWPTDEATTAALAAAKEAGAKVPEVKTNQGGMDVKGSGSGQVSNFDSGKDFKTKGFDAERTAREAGKK